MIPVDEIAAIVDISVRAVLRRRADARAAERGELVNEAWLVALESLPRASAEARDLGAYLGTAITRSLARSLRRWNREPAAGFVPDVADPAPGPDELLVARAAAARAFDGLDHLDRQIARALLGLSGRRAARARDVADAFAVPVGRVYQARQNLARRAQRIGASA